MNRSLFAAVAALMFAFTASAQPRPMDKTSKPAATKAPAVSSVTAKYEGGMFGFSQKTDGTLKFDDENSRLVFYDKTGKELFGLPYASLLVIYPQSKAVTTTAGNVVKWIPLPGAGLAGFIKEKRRYLVAQFDDPDVDVKGVVNFKLDDKETLDSALQTLADKANLEQRGDAFYRPKAKSSD
jgi:hypothetical protein